MARRVFQLFLIAGLLTAALAVIPTSADAAAGTPTVNGLYFGDGDEANYYFLMEGTNGRGDVYYNLTGNTLYLLMLVDESVNDNVFGWSKKHHPDRPYVESAGWGQEHSAQKLIGSDHLEAGVSCGDLSWQWSQDYVYRRSDYLRPKLAQNIPFQTDWLSDPYGPDGGGTPPPGLIASASSMQWNFNNTEWDYTLDWTRIGNKQWKSPDVDGDDDVATDGWPGYNSAVKWEWPMVYEIAIDLDASGCQGYPLQVQIFSAHNSPAKDGEGEDLPIPPVALIDYGDAPDSYGTLLTSDGARHYVVPNGPVLGADVDAEADGQPNADATGDDLLDGNNDNNGAVFATDLVAGREAQVKVTGTAGARLDAWIDWNGNGVFDAGERIVDSLVLTGAADTLTFTVPPDAVEGDTYARFRVSSAGGLSPTGLAADGEVEDYLVDPHAPTAVTLSAFKATPSEGAIIIEWETASELDLWSFDITRAETPEGPRARLNEDVIPSQAPGSVLGNSYEYSDLKVVPGQVYYYWLEAVDGSGQATVYGPVSAAASQPHTSYRVFLPCITNGP